MPPRAGERSPPPPLPPPHTHTTTTTATNTSGPGFYRSPIPTLSPYGFAQAIPFCCCSLPTSSFAAWLLHPPTPLFYGFASYPRSLCFLLLLFFVVLISSLCAGMLLCGQRLPSLFSRFLFFSSVVHLPFKLTISSFLLAPMSFTQSSLLFPRRPAPPLAFPSPSSAPLSSRLSSSYSARIHVCVCVVYSHVLPPPTPTP